MCVFLFVCFSIVAVCCCGQDEDGICDLVRSSGRVVLYEEEGIRGFVRYSGLGDNLYVYVCVCVCM